MTRLAIAVLDDFQNVARGMADWPRIAGHADLTVFTDHVDGPALVQRLQPFDVVVAIRERTPFPRSLIEQLPRLKLIATTGMRNAGIDGAACRDRGIPVLGTAGGSHPAAELTFGLIMALARNLVDEDRSLRAGTWETERLGFELTGRTLGLLGLGKLGSRVAGYGKAFGMDVIAWSPNLTDERAAAGGARRVDKATLFQASDFVSIHVVLSDRSRGIVGAEDLARMQPGAYLVNTSRAALVDEAALVAALHAGRIAGAGLDVFNEEPVPPGAAILAAPRTILTPHLGYATRENYQEYFPQVLECIEGWMDGKLIRELPAG